MWFLGELKFIFAIQQGAFVEQTLLVRFVSSNRIGSGDVFGDDGRSTCFSINHDVVEIAFGTDFLIALFYDFEFDTYAVATHFGNVGADENFVTEGEAAFVVDVGGFDIPAKTAFEEVVHRHLVAAFHLIKSSGENVVEIARIMDVAIHVDVVGADIERGFEGGKFSVHFSRRNEGRGDLATKYRVS